MIRLCPNCNTERPLSEFFCENVVADGKTCNWDLTSVAIREPGMSSDQPINVGSSVPTSGAPVAYAWTCPNGHPIEEGDLLCLTCGAEIEIDSPAPVAVVSDSAIDTNPVSASVPTEISGWTVESRITSSSAVRERFIATNPVSGQKGVLTLYADGAEPDTAVYDAIRNMPLDHLPEIFEIGRWNDRAYEISEEITGGTLEHLASNSADPQVLRTITFEIGKALGSFSQAGLRHRDIRPSNILIRTAEPLDLVISGFGSARLSDYDLDIVAPLETTRYMAPEAIAGGVSAASDWWSLGMIVLEIATAGKCFEGVNSHALLIHIITNGVEIPADIPPTIATLLRGLLTRDHRDRWQWREVRAWYDGEDVPVSDTQQQTVELDGRAAISLGGREFRKPSGYALAAAEPGNWDEARNQVSRGSVAAWVEDAGVDTVTQAAIRRLSHTEGLMDDLKLSLALKILHPSMPLIVRGNIVTPGWLLDHPVEGTELIFGPATEFLHRLGVEEWLQRMKQRGLSVREKAKQFSIQLNEEDLQIHLLSTSKARLAALWAERRRIFPDTDHPGLNSLIERRQTTEEDFILLLSAEVSQFRSVDEILDEAAKTADRAGVHFFDREDARQFLQHSRRDLHAMIDDRLNGFSRSGIERVDEWADQFRLDRRISLDRSLVLLSVPSEHWLEPPKQAYVSTLLEYFSKKISGSILRGPLTKMTIGKTTPRVDVTELGTERRPAPALLDHILARTDQTQMLDPAAIGVSDTLERRMRSLHAHSTLYKRDTGIDGMYLGFPFLLHREDRTRTRIAPILLWPIKIIPEVGNRGHASIGFDRDREEVRLNPAFEGMFGIDAARRWQEAANDLLGRSTLTAADVVDGFGGLAELGVRQLGPLPGKDTAVDIGRPKIVCAGVFFHLAYMGQAIVEDLRALKGKQLGDSGLETALKVTEVEPKAPEVAKIPELDRYFTVASDPSQEAAVLEARNAPGLVIQGPPGTGKSQTIVNMVADAIGRKKSLLVVCQKQAALEVVKKRLEAEGLEDRIFMITDTNRDREPIITAIRDQLAAQHGAAGAQGWRRDRQNLAMRIEAIEKDLNVHHEALHRIDETTGLSYRELLGELIELEASGVPLDVPALRRLLGRLEPGAVAALAEACAPQARFWLPSKFEGNALASLKIFNPDEANRCAFHGDFIAFVDRETECLAVLTKTDHALPMNDPEPYRLWFDRNDAEFRHLEDRERLDLARWLRFCGRRAGTGSKALEIANELSEVARHLRSLNGSSPADNVRRQMIVLDDSALQADVELARAVTTQPTGLGKLNPFRWLRAKRLKARKAELGLEGTTPADLLRAGEWELQLRPLRDALMATLEGLDDDNLVNREMAWDTLIRVADDRHAALEKTQALADAAFAFPSADAMAEVVAKATLAQYEQLRDSADQAFERHEAKQFSRASLSNAEQWFEPGWVEARLRAIDDDKGNDTAIGAIFDALATLEPFQRFRIRLNALPTEAMEIFAVLRTKGNDLQSIPPQKLEDEVRKIVNREARLAWKAKLESDFPQLLYDTPELQSKIRTVADNERAMQRANKQMLAYGVDGSKIASEREWEPITRLRGQRAQRLREFLEKGPDLGLMELRPVWLMNPDVASRVLPLRKGMFDIVIYDEASQMPVEYALPTLFRGKIAIVSGDEKQMPPTAFFSSKVENDEADVFDGEDLDEDATEVERETYNDTWNRREIKDCPDLLQLAKSVMPTTTLQIHYRSAYRELIGFSNASFYANRLSVPVRHPDDEIRRARPIEVIRVDGVYADQKNEIEAEKVVDVLADLWNADGRKPTVGVVTFNRKQADLIDEVLEARAQRDEQFRTTLARERDRVEGGEDVGFFVKNVENVQGDERDVIIFSSTFGRNAQGSFRRNFGVLGQKGGERRLNVAVTRARAKVIMVTSMPIELVSDMLSSRRKPTVPRDYLQGYLEYARTMSDGDFATGRMLLDRLVTERSAAQYRGEDSLDGFANSVFEYLSELGVEPHRVNDGSAFGLDFAIEDPRTGLYGLGIECDAPRHKILDNARAREIWRPSVLKRSIPNIHRVSSHGWYHNPEEERQRLRSAVEAALYKEAAE
ncbi:AAA domain-containing protein (plasmid) [Rhizobium sp. CB3171]|uniref:protein kinase domain-containing protein n=1 Tax=Rhizobium sp. CB3171 TaxID=3039157 RepID=UPI0024B08D4D|nr:AAA domain-containing protein [Rhizobium sp. CB3171]WFU04592.1 AAA domain-containing protein [Rhizobium sp. CB3171]